VRVAIKQIHRHCLIVEQLQNFKRAAALELALAPHASIVRLHGWSMQPDTAQLLLVMEYCEDGTLESLIKTAGHTGGGTRPWTDAQALTAALHIARGIAFLHAQEPPLLHRDLKPANILFGSGVAKLADFGASRVDDGTHITAGSVGTPLFAAPEQLTYQAYSTAVDLWAYGCVLTCIAKHEPTPYGLPHEISDGLLSQVASGSCVPNVPDGHVLRGLVRASCVSKSQRAKAAELVERIVEALRDVGVTDAPPSLP